MEVKINREIRNYTESMFFGLSLRQFIFSSRTNLARYIFALYMRRLNILCAFGPAIQSSIFVSIRV